MWLIIIIIGIGVWIWINDYITQKRINECKEFAKEERIDTKSIREETKNILSYTYSISKCREKCPKCDSGVVSYRNLYGNNYCYGCNNPFCRYIKKHV